jgi:hypothetical protein
MDESELDPSEVGPPGECGRFNFYCHVRRALSEFAQWLPEGIETAAATILQAIWTPLRALLEPAIVFLEDQAAGLANISNGIPEGVWYYASGLAIGEGIAIMLTALVIRFVIRRIPLIG